jgi:hypothetical protein
MKRRVGNVLVGFSLVICIALCVFWVRSYWRSDAWWFESAQESAQLRRVRIFLVYNGAGRVQLAMARNTLYGPESWRPRHWFTYRAGSGPANPANTAVTAGWVKTFAGFGVINDWQLAPPPAQIERWVTVSGTLVINDSFRSLFVPHWFLILVFGMMPARRIYQRVKSRRRRRWGLCEGCGYDLRGGGGRCPECGAETTGGTRALRETS